MSLENQIANLVGAANNLTSEVAGKMRQIDNKVDAATASVPTAVKGMMSNRWYVDAINGNDSSDGSRNAPFQTLAKAMEEGIPGSSSQIFLKNGQRHLVKEKTIIVNQQQVSVYPWDWDGIASMPEVEFFQRSAEDANAPFAPHRVNLTNSHLAFYAIKIIHPSYRSNYTPPSSSDGIENTVILSMNSTVHLDYKYSTSTEILLGDDENSRFIMSNRALSNLVMASANVSGNSGIVADNRFGGAIMIRTGSISLSNGIELYPATETSVVNASVFLP